LFLSYVSSSIVVGPLVLVALHWTFIALYNGIVVVSSVVEVDDDVDACDTLQIIVESMAILFDSKNSNVPKRN
jgi:hypothetical protein